MSGRVVPYQIEYAFLEEDYDLCEQLHAERMYCLWLLLLHLSGKKRTFCTDQNGKRYGETENAGKGGKESLSQTRVINGPHIRTERTTRNVMMNVSISLVPALLGAIYFFGIRALFGRAFHYRVCSYRVFLAEINEKTGNSRRFSALWLPDFYWY